MDPERWQRIKDLFTTVLELPPGKRAAWLSSALPDDPSLAGEVEQLIAAHEAADDFYEQGALAAVPAVRRQLEGEAAGMRLGPYRVLSQLGHGGMGAVYLAVRDQPGFTQKVAIKLIKRGMDTEEIVRRFVAERQILASLAHPNIARLFDGGSTPDGLPYFVMEYVEGRPITAHVEERKLSIEDRLHLFQRVCHAVQHAHQSLVVHRDLKPANILVEVEGEPKLLDFGIAKLMDPTSFATALTGIAPGPMTPDYASPEQRAGGLITTATDVYGLGLLLYELLVGQNPRSVERRLGEGWSERPPSQAIVALAEGDAEKRRLARRLTGDLDTIVGKALERDPELRYGTAQALAEDVERHLTQRPVVARRPTLSYRLGRTLVRYKLAAALVLAICLLAAVTSWFAFANGVERRRAEAERERAEALNSFLQGLVQKANPEQSRGEVLTVRQVLDAGTDDLLGRDSRYQPETWASLLEATGTIYENLGLYEQAKKNLLRALRLRESLGDASTEGELALAGTLTSLGSVSLNQEAYAPAIGYFERALTLRERQLAPTALPLAEDLNGLGTAVIMEGRLDEAGRHFERALAISSQALEEGRRDLADSYNNLGYLAFRRGELARAQFLFTIAFHYFRSSFGEEHPQTTAIRSNLAFILGERGDSAGAEVLSQKIVDVHRHLLEPGHPDLVQALLDLAIAQRNNRHLDQARATLDELLRMRRDHRLPRDQNEAEAWNMVGAIAYAAKDLDAADAAYARSYEIYGSLAGDHRVRLANVLNGQALVRLLRDDAGGALALAHRSLELVRSMGADAGDMAAHTEILLGHCYRAAGQPSLARPHLERGYKVLLELYGPEHPATREVASLLKRPDAAGE